MRVQERELKGRVPDLQIVFEKVEPFAGVCFVDLVQPARKVFFFVPFELLCCRRFRKRKRENVERMWRECERECERECGENVKEMLT